MTVTLLSVITITGHLAAEVIADAYTFMGMGACVYVAARLGTAVHGYLHARHDPEWAAAYFPQHVREVLAAHLRASNGTAGSVACKACHGYAWMIAENTADGPVTSMGHAWTRRSVDRRVSRTRAARDLWSRDGDPLLPEHVAEPPGD